MKNKINDDIRRLFSITSKITDTVDTTVSAFVDVERKISDIKSVTDTLLSGPTSIVTKPMFDNLSNLVSNGLNQLSTLKISYDLSSANFASGLIQSQTTDTALIAQITDLSARTTVINNLFNSLNNNYTSLKNTVDSLNALEITDINALSGIAISLSSINSSLTTLKTRSDTFDTQFTDIFSKIQLLMNTSTMNTTALSTLTPKVDSNTMSISNLTSTVNTNVTNLANLTSTVTGNSNMITSINSSIQSINSSVTALQNSVSSINTNLVNLNSLVNTNTSNISSLQSGLVTTNTNLSNSTTSLSNRATSLETTTSNLTSTVNSITTRTTNLESSNTSVLGRLTTDETNITSLMSRIATLESANVLANVFSYFNSSANANVPNLNTNTALNMSGAFTNTIYKGNGSIIQTPGVGLYRIDATTYWNINYQSNTSGSFNATDKIYCYIWDQVKGIPRASQLRYISGASYSSGVVTMQVSAEFICTDPNNFAAIYIAPIYTSPPTQIYTFGSIRRLTTSVN